jgi:hypothetical protein
LPIQRLEFASAYCLLGREAELHRLIAWATRKRLTKPRKVYQNRLYETQVALTRIRIRSPRIWHLAWVCFTIADWLFPPPRHLQKGSGAGYKFKPRRLTGQAKSDYTVGQ